MRYHDPDGLGGMIGALVVVSALVGIIIVGSIIVVLILAGVLVVTVLKVRPASLSVWIGLGVFSLFLLLSLFTNGQPVAILLCLISFVAVLIACWVEKARHPQLFEKVERPLVINELIRNQWWTDTEDEPDDEEEQQQAI